MNKQIEKAIEYMRFSMNLQLASTRAIIQANGRKKLGKRYLRNMGRRIACYKVSISALKKQIPKKPILLYNYEDLIDKLYCPTCNMVRVNKGENYCIECGQAIDWSVEE